MTLKQNAQNDTKNIIDEMNDYVQFMYNIPPTPEKYLLVNPATVQKIKDCVMRFEGVYRSFDDAMCNRIIGLSNNLFLPMRDVYSGAFVGSYAIDKIQLGCLCAFVDLSRTLSFQGIVKKKPTKIFISHSTGDAEYIKLFVGMLEKIGVRKEHLFCSSVTGYDIPLNENIYDFLRKQFEDYNLYVILMLSKNYYKSPACLNEMGAAWALKAEYQAVLLPDFSFKKIDGAIDPQKISFKISDTKVRTSRLTELKNKVVEMLGIPNLDEIIWERHKTDFINEVDRII